MKEDGLPGRPSVFETTPTDGLGRPSSDMAVESLIDQIVNGVLKQLGTVEGDAAPASTTAVEKRSSRQGTIELAEPVITAEVVADRIGGAGVVSIPTKSIITPAAWDVIRELGIEVQRPGRAGDVRSKAAVNEGSGAFKSASCRLLIVVRNTEAVDRIWLDLQSSWRRELLGCSDDAAKLAIGEITRGETTSVVILAEQSHRAACLANRHEKVKAAAIRDAADVKVIAKQLKCNVWCLDPTGRSWFELRNVFRAIG